MVKLTFVGKSVAVSALIGLSVFVPARIASADTVTNFVPNTITCNANLTSEVTHGGVFTVKWDNGNKFTINVTKAPTTPVTLYASSYHLTSNLYNGGCFSHDATTGTSPQTYDNNTQTIVLPVGVTGSQTVTVVLPTTCYNEQVDMYFGDSYGKPLNGTVTSAGHDNYGWIAGNIMLTAQNAACVGGSGAGPTTPETPVVVTPAAAVTPTLSDTGLNIRLTSVLAAAFLVAAGYVFTRRAKANQ